MADWRALFDKRIDKKWDSFSWLTARALISSVNDGIAALAPHLVTDLRSQWLSERPVPAGAWNPQTRVIDRQSEATWLVVGDTGEQDASQYVVAPALAAQSGTVDFMVILSDVIYPSGDVNDYRDGYYIPYEGFTKPILALAGNHDWYDGLTGFMWHFCHVEPLEHSAFYNDERSANERFMRRFVWRKPSAPQDRADLESRRAARSQSPLQPGPYYAIDTQDVRLICIDTGIDGKLDRAQGEWLLARAKEPGKPKVLLTGKPLMVNQTLKECQIDGMETVHAIVTEPAHDFIATIGGDTHNFQHYETTVGSRPFHHIVSGGGGAFMSATHTIAAPTAGAVEASALYPTPAASLMHFAKLVIPGVWRLVRLLLAALLGMALASGLIDWIPGLAIDRDLLRAGVWAATFLLAAGVLARIATQKLTDWSGYRALQVAGAVLAGAVLVGTGWRLAPERFEENLLAWAGLTAGGCALAWLIRRTHWWRRHAPGHEAPTLVLVLAALALLGIPVLAWLATGDWWLTATGAVVALVGIGGAFLRGKEHWGGLAVVAAVGVQFVAALIVLERVVVPATAREPYNAAACALVVTLIACAIFIKLAQAAIGVVLAGILVAGFLLDGDTQRAALLAPLALLGPPAVLFLIDLARRKQPGRYKAICLLAAVAAAVLGHVVIGAWFLPALAAVAVILAATVLAIAVIHLMFLGAFALVWHPGGHGEKQYESAEEAEAALAWRAGKAGPPAERRVRRITNIVYPGAANPHGPIQKFVSEIFDSDRPPFFKNFLHMRTAGGKLIVSVHAVTGEGDAPSQVIRSIEIPFS